MTSSMTTRQGRRDKGATIPIVALVLPVLILATAFAVDLGRQRALRRDLQADADVVALDLARLIEPASTAASLEAVTLDALNASLQQNGVDPVAGFTDLDAYGVLVEWGRFSTSSCGLDVSNLDSCFIRAQSDIDSVRVTLSSSIDYFFQPGEGAATRSAVATVGADDSATLRLGSFAARVRSGDSPLLAPLLNDVVDADVGGYDGLVDSELPLGDFLPFLPDVGAGVLDPDQVLDAEVGLDDFLLAGAEALRSPSTNPSPTPADLANAELLEAIAANVGHLPPIRLGDLVAAEQGTGDAALGADVNLLDLVAAGLLIANGQNGIVVPPPTVAIPGLVQINTPCNNNPGDDATEVCSAVTAIQRPITFTGRPGTARSTKQVGVRAGAQLTVPPLVNVSSQVNVAVATGQARIESIDCDAMSVTARVTTGLLETSVRITAEVDVSVSILGLGLTVVRVPVTITGTRAPSSVDEVVTFYRQPDGTYTPEIFEAGVGDLGLSGLNLQVLPEPPTILGISITLLRDLAAGIVNPLLSSTLGPLLGELEARLVMPILNTLGANVAGADLATLDQHCGLGGLTLVE